MPGFGERLARFFFGSVIDRAVAREVNAAVSVRVDDSAGWEEYGRLGPADRPWGDRLQDLGDALEAWRKNFLIRRLVNLTRSYVVGGGVVVSSGHRDVERFVRAFWDHPKNRMDRRLGPMCDELTRSGELFSVLFTNRVDGMSYVRLVPASSIAEIETEEDDYEVELRYGERRGVEPRWWLSPAHPEAGLAGDGGKLQPVMLHFAVNQVVGAVRGEGDLGPVLPWAKRYSEWLKDRVRLNRQRTRQGLLDVEIADDSMVEAKRRQLATSNPVAHGIYVHGPGEKVTMHELSIRAGDVTQDGKLLRLAAATGANVALHFLGEGESVNYATAKEMGEPTTLFYAERQRDLCGFLVDLVSQAYRRKVAMGLARMPRGEDLQLSVSVGEVSQADNAGLAQAAATIVGALAQMKVQGWIDDATAVEMAFRFAGRPLSEGEIERILYSGEQ